MEFDKRTVIERFLKYVSFHTTSDEESLTTPSSERQLKLAEYIKKIWKK